MRALMQLEPLLALFAAAVLVAYASLQAPYSGLHALRAELAANDLVAVCQADADCISSIAEQAAVSLGVDCIGVVLDGNNIKSCPAGRFSASAVGTKFDGERFHSVKAVIRYG